MEKEGPKMALFRYSRRPLLRWTPLLILAAVVLALAALTSSAPGVLIVHEWGTFVSMEGSDGLALDGLHHDEADLPRFVHSRPRDQLRLRATTSKLETPVLYFYPQGPSPAKYVNVRVDFPEGILTQWYPQAALSSPWLLHGDAPPPLKGGYLQWFSLILKPGGQTNSAVSPALPSTAPGDVWNF